MKKTKIALVAACVIRNRKTGKYVVVNQNYDSWSLPKGHVDKGEDELAAAKREAYEESGLKALRLIKELPGYERYRLAKNGGDDLKELKKISVFYFDTKEQDLRPVDPANPVAEWIKKEKVAAMLTHKKDSSYFESIMALID